jgi:hypothetical protein
MLSGIIACTNVFRLENRVDDDKYQPTHPTGSQVSRLDSVI